MSKKYQFQFICVIDFEATCEQDIQGFYPHEIIEFPAVLIDSYTEEVLSTFHSFVRPVINTQLSDFCKTLTGISQESVDKAETFPYVLSRFLDWINNIVPKGDRFVLLTDGASDVIKFLNLQCCISQIDFPSWAKSWINIKRSFKRFRPNGPADEAVLFNMLEAFGLEFEGRLHSGKDDAHNIARLALEMLKTCGPLVPNSKVAYSSASCMKKMLSQYLQKNPKSKPKRKKPSSRKRMTVSGNSTEGHAPHEYAMDIDPDLVGSESVLYEQKKKCMKDV